MAGALGVALEKTGHYRLGRRDPYRLSRQDISRAVQTMYWVTAQAGMVAAGIIVLMTWLNL